MKDFIVYDNLFNVLFNCIGIYLTIKYLKKSCLRLRRLPDGLDSEIILARKYIKTSIKLFAIGLILMVVALCYSLNTLLVMG